MKSPRSILLFPLSLLPLCAIAQNEQSDTVRHRVSPTIATTEKDLHPQAGDLKQPENLPSEAFYDEASGTYRIGTKLGEHFLTTPLFMSIEEYNRWSLQQSLRSYYRKKNAEAFSNNGKERFDFSDMKFDLGIASKIFGPGGVRIKTQGAAEIKLGANMRFVDNPSLAERNRRVMGFDFNEKINVSLSGSVGDKVNMDFNYNSDATFTFDAQSLKLRYEGKEDEIIKLIEAGNVSFPTNSSLITGASSLMGLRTDLQFGKLKLQTIVAQKKSSSSSVTTSGGVQLQSFEFSANNYEENRHFFLSHFFRDHYDENMSQLPNILSGVKINRLEVWTTNISGTPTNTRNLIALTDLGEQSAISNTKWQVAGGETPSNAANNEYAALLNAGAAARNTNTANASLSGLGLVGGVDYEKLESARLLSPSEYDFNESLGYISLRASLQAEQVLAVAFEYTYGGKTYQVGEFSSDIADNSQSLFVKSLKNTANEPSQGNWHLMMKNVYSLGAVNVQKEKFRLDIKYLSDSSNVYLNYLPEESLRNQKILQLVGADRLDNNNKRNPNSYFDFVEGFTINTTTGRIYFPVLEPFGRRLKEAISNSTVADKYAFQELYDLTKTAAKQIAEKDRFYITGQYKATKTGQISLGSTNIPQGSVVVTAGGATLREGVDYNVDYYSGIVTILNQSILSAGTPINASVESNTYYGLQRKTLLGLNWQYNFSKDFQFGGTLLHLSERALTTKTSMGAEPLNNTLLGFNLSYKKENQWLTNLVNKLPFTNSTVPSNINFTAEVAKLFVGKNNDSQGNASYIDDFENSKSEIDVSTPTEWMISSTPVMFPEHKLTNDIRYGYNRALLAWYNIDPLFTRRSSSLTPGYIKTDLDQLSDPYVREVYQQELFPNRQIQTGESSTINVLNLAYYPTERGPYNLDPKLTREGKLPNPHQRWGGMMRRLETTDFETANIQYIEFWLMDPFIKSKHTSEDLTGDLYLNLGEISEDVLNDGHKFYESGLPAETTSTDYTQTIWGRVPNGNSVTYAFNTSSGARALQDVGYNGLSSAAEATFPTYQSYLSQIRSIVSPTVYDSIAANPSGDRYHYFRGDDYDAARKNILERYKYINNPNGNSPEATNETYSTAYKTTPDVEDINQDYTLNEYDKYYQYHIRIEPSQMVVGRNFIVDSRTTTETTRNGKRQEVTWYQFRIPVENFESRVGNISDFSSIRFMRAFVTNFKNPVVLRFATMNLVHGEWRAYEQPLSVGGTAGGNGDFTVSAVNYEENNEKTPVNYVLPPGISRVVDPGQSQVLQNDEQSLAMTVHQLSSGDARAVYKAVSLDLRRYKHLQMFTHANSLAGSTPVTNGQVSVFLRLGTDYRNNYYEYEVPLTITPDGNYASSGSGPEAVWPASNLLNVDLSKLTQIKKKRNVQKSAGGASVTEVFSEYDAHFPNNKISVMGNPSLGDVRTIMIGVRNNSRQSQSAEVWVNELRLQDYTSEGGWAAQGNLNVQLSDVASVNLSGHIETSGFGGIEQTVAQRRHDDYSQYSVTTNVQLGKLVPEQLQLNAPLYYSYSKQKTAPQYNPFDTDLTIKDAEAGLTKTQRDSLELLTSHIVTHRNLSLSGLRFNIRASKRQPLPFDPANFSFSYSMTERYTSGDLTAWEKDNSWKWSLTYNYSPNLKTYSPFKRWRSKSKWVKFFKEIGLNPAPQNISFSSDITRNYYELQERDLENIGGQRLPLTWSSDFFWNRNLSLRWDLTRNIHMNFSSATNAEIEQPYTAVNKDLYPTQYEAWKDSVWTSIRHLGTPLTYQQSFELSYKIPLNKLPIFEWITSDVSYNSTYNWTRGADLDDGTFLGNTIANTRNINGNARLNLERLYNYIPFLKKANQRFQNSDAPAPPKKPVKFEKEVRLHSDTTTVLTHGKKTKKLRLTAIRSDGSFYPIKYEIKDENTVVLLTKDTTTVKVTIVPKPKAEEQSWYKTLQYVARGAMMLRNFNVSYRNTYNMALPGFKPIIGDILGQRSGGGFAPGIPFALGMVDKNYIQRAADRGWLLMSDSIATPATTLQTEDLQIRATLEPIRNLKIDLTATRHTNQSNSIQFNYVGMPTTQSGSFTMTTLSLGTAFSSLGDANNGYANATFQKFVASLAQFREEVEQQYIGKTYPLGMPLGGSAFNPSNGTIDPYSADVMIPAFLHAYSGSGDRLRIFPTLSKLLPNWSVSYSGLSRLRAMKKIFRSFNINHSYRSQYAVSGYSSFSSFRSAAGDLGFIMNTKTGLPTPSTMYNISTVSINEAFNPLLGVDMTFLNNMTARLEMRRNRALTLSMTSLQLTETRANDYVIGMGYRIQSVSLFSPKRSIRSKGRKSTTGKEQQPAATSNNNRGWASDLNLRMDITFRNQSALNRNIQTLRSEATSGNRSLQISFAADYALSKYLTLTAYYDRMSSTPLLTSSSYPTTTQDFGVSLKFTLTR